MASTYRDRTSEFRSLTETLKKIGGATAPRNQPENAPATSQASSYSRSEFNRKASRIGLGIHETSQKIARLAQLAKKSSMFNDPMVEIQELTGLIKNDITALNSALSDLQNIQQMDMAEGNYSEDRSVHSTAVCDDLKGRLMGATKHLQDVLTARTENIKAHENRRQIFSKTAARENPFQHQPKPATEPPPWSNSSNASENLQETSGLPPNGAPAGNQLRRRLAVDNAPSQQMEMSLVQQVVPRQDNYAQSRVTALHNVESTITELSGIFTHLATMVAHQGELAIRIDDNMDESLANVEGAHSSLLRHLNRISSNRWLLIKIFGILILFLMIFIFFIA
ncbi:syntaxin-31 [Lotus japonicus]|uniref:syntaxin-31 n=1 Tax=Lotus japonicus TaxID=34305 RepID=UPI002583E61C|nr:syntaxin-31 [Lotus japonicus]